MKIMAGTKNVDKNDELKFTTFCPQKRQRSKVDW